MYLSYHAINYLPFVVDKDSKKNNNNQETEPIFLITTHIFGCILCKEDLDNLEL